MSMGKMMIPNYYLHDNDDDNEHVDNEKSQKKPNDQNKFFPLFSVNNQGKFCSSPKFKLMVISD